ncbi:MULTISPECIES: glycosyltransferase family 4 protein [unclassified Pedobacter]|uniref:glycosyltransferase family 4 protein n=1 Tax=unclassified Pedobacter TaxID=2628915 RepID=UPI0014242840|nr:MULTISPECIES: glycosyltransferase family 1 protein [unclassified Pedobacter]NII80996.1 mannosyltransferase [Pedobacter sp. SG908]NMN35011.1 mannosyltransferase [Pedobacter sp. SG918]
MQVFFDNSVFSIQKAGGVSAYWYELLSGMCNSELSIGFLNARPKSDNIFEKKIDYNRFHCIQESRIPLKYLRYLPLRYTLPTAAIFHGGYLRISPQKDILNILTVHDFAHERKLASKFPRGLANTMQKAYGIRRADGIICISNSTRQELLHFFPGINPAKIKVIHHGIGNFYPINKQQPANCSLDIDLREKFILYVGARRNYKNFFTAVKTIELLPPSFNLVVVGGELWDKKEIGMMNKKIPGRYRIFQTISQSDLNILYNHAFCLLYTSAYEGFGFPLGEAMKAGCPVVTTNMTSMPEVVGKAGLMADRPDPLLFAEKISALENETFKQRLIAQGLQQVQQFTWNKSVQETINFYKDCWNLKFST